MIFPKHIFLETVFFSNEGGQRLIGGGVWAFFEKASFPKKNIKYSQAWKKRTGARPARPAGPLAGPLAFIFPSCSPVLIFFFFPGIINELTKRGKQAKKKRRKKGLRPNSNGGPPTQHFWGHQKKEGKK